MKRFLAFFIVIGMCGHAHAAVFTVAGDLFDNSSTKIGEFEIQIDEADLTITMTSAHPSLAAPLAIEPWYGYDVLSASVSLFDYSWTEASVLPTEPPVGGGPTAEFWIEGAPIADLDTEDFMIFFDDDTGYIGIGFGNGGDDQRIDNEVFWQIPTDDGPPNNGSSHASSGGGYQNVTVAIPEPASAAMLAIGGVALLRRRRNSN